CGVRWRGRPLRSWRFRPSTVAFRAFRGARSAHNATLGGSACRHVRGPAHPTPADRCTAASRALVPSTAVPDLAALIPALATASWLLVAVGAVVVGLSKTAMPGGGTIAVGL